MLHCPSPLFNPKAKDELIGTLKALLSKFHSPLSDVVTGLIVMEDYDRDI